MGRPLSPPSPAEVAAHAPAWDAHHRLVRLQHVALTALGVSVGLLALGTGKLDFALHWIVICLASVVVSGGLSLWFKRRVNGFACPRCGKRFHRPWVRRAACAHCGLPLA